MQVFRTIFEHCARNDIMQEYRFTRTGLAKYKTMNMINRIHQEINLIATWLFTNSHFDNTVRIFIWLVEHLIIVSLNHSCLRFPLSLLVNIVEKGLRNARIFQVRYMFSLFHTLQIQFRIMILHVYEGFILIWQFNIYIMQHHKVDSSLMSILKQCG